MTGISTFFVAVIRVLLPFSSSSVFCCRGTQFKFEVSLLITVSHLAVRRMQWERDINLKVNSACMKFREDEGKDERKDERRRDVESASPVSLSLSLSLSLLHKLYSSLFCNLVLPWSWCFLFSLLVLIYIEKRDEIKRIFQWEILCEWSDVSLFPLLFFK